MLHIYMYIYTCIHVNTHTYTYIYTYIYIYIYTCVRQTQARGGHPCRVCLEVVTATVDIDQVITYRSSTQSRNLQADASDSLETVHVEFSLVRSDYSAETSPTTPISANILDPMEEIARGPAIWLWDYLRRSSGNGST